MTQTRICLVRHGETDWNAQYRLQGHQDIPLNARGLAQAAAVAQALRGERFDAIYSSDLQRAQTTARAIADVLALPLQLEARFRERHFGALQGLTRAEADQRHPGEYARVRMREPQACPPGEGGESLAGFAERIQHALLTVCTRHAGGRILIVSHGGCMDIMYRLASGKPLTEARDFPLGNATLNWLAHADESWQILSWDERRHLESSAEEISP